MTASVSLEPRFSDDGLAVGEYARVVVFVWRGPPTRHRLERVVDAFAAVAARLRGPLSVLAVIEASSPPPSLADLPYSATAFDTFADILAASVAVIEERGAASVLFEAVASVQALRRRPSATKFCVDVSEAAAWLCTRHPHGDADPAFRAGLIAAVEQIRESLPL